MVDRQLTPALKRTIARDAIARQGIRGGMTRLAREHRVSRQTAYTLERRALRAIEREFSAASEGSAFCSIDVDQRHVTRAVLALRVVGHNSIPDIVELSETLLGIRRGFGTVWRLLDDAANTAEDVLREVRLDAIKAVALDEIFTGSTPVLVGRCLDTGYVFCCQRAEKRDGDSWRAALAPCVVRGLAPGVVISDGAKGILAASKALWPKADHRDDLFHIVKKLKDEARYWFNRAIRAIDDEYKMEDRRARCAPPKRRSLGQKMRALRARSLKLIERSDVLEALVKRVSEELDEPLDLERGHIRHSAEIRDALFDIASKIGALGPSRLEKISRTLERAIPGLLGHLDDRDEAVLAIEEAFGVDATRFAALFVDARRRLRRGELSPDRVAQLSAARLALNATVPDEALRDEVLHEIEAALQARYHRASSTVESFNSLLRPHFDVQRGASQRFLSLFAAYQNLRHRRSGRHKGMSAHQLLADPTQRGVHHWLDVLEATPPTLH